MPEETTVVENLNFEDYLENRQHMPNPKLVRRINEKTFPFDKNTFFVYNPAKLAADEYNRCVSTYVERANNQTPMDAMRLMQELLAEEEPDREVLQDLAIELVREMYNVPDSIDLRAMLKTNDPGEECAECQPEEDRISAERKEELKSEIEKRRILNSIVHGAAIHQWTSAYYIVADKLNDINPDLLAKYNTLSALVNFWNWATYQQDMFEMGMAPVLQGINKVKPKEKRIEASAMNFPVLIHELSKGVIDYLITKGLPELPMNELQYIMKEADKYSHEQWHYCFGPTLWRAMLETSDVSSHDLPPIISAMAQMDYVELSHFCIDIAFHQDEIGKDRMSTLKKSLGGSTN